MGGTAAVIGLVTRDLFVFVAERGAAATSFVGYGGVLHAIAAFRRGGKTTSLVSQVDREALTEILHFDPELDHSALLVSDSCLPQCSLFWAPGATEPVEHTGTAGVSLSHEHVLASVEVAQVTQLYVNLTVGHDLEWRTLAELSRRGIRLYLDPHMLLYARDALGARYLSPPADWKDWLAVADVIQMSSVEYGAVCEKAGISSERFRDSSELLLRCVGPKPWAVIRTSQEVVDLAFRLGDSVRVKNIPVRPVSVPHAAYTIGCGDALGAGAFSGLQDRWDPEGLLKGLTRGIQWAADSLHVLGIYWGKVSAS